MANMTLTEIIADKAVDEPVDVPELIDIDGAVDELFALKNGVTYVLDMDGHFYDANGIPAIGCAQRINSAKYELQYA